MGHSCQSLEREGDKRSVTCLESFCSHQASTEKRRLIETEEPTNFRLSETMMKKVQTIFINILILVLLTTEFQALPIPNNNLQKCLDDLNTHVKYFGRPRYGRSIRTLDFDSGRNDKEQDKETNSRLTKYQEDNAIPEEHQNVQTPEILVFSDCNLMEEQLRQRQLDTLRLMSRLLKVIG